MNDNTGTQSESKNTWMEKALLFILILCAIIYALVFSAGQICANHTILDLKQTLKQAVSEGNVSLVEYNAAIKYMELSQQAYNASTTTNMISIIYGLVTAVILGYGIKMLRLGEAERQKLHEMEPQLTKLKDDMEQRMQKRFEQQNEIYIATTSCRNAAHICSLIQSYIAFLEQESKDISNISADNIIYGLEKDFIQSLNNFSDLMEKYSKKADELTNETFAALSNSWALAKSSIKTYCSDETGKPSLIKRAFGETDDTVVNERYEKIDECFQKIKADRRAQDKKRRRTQK